MKCSELAPDVNRQYVLHTDWSQLGLGCVLGQVDDKGQEYMVACQSRSLNEHEKRYTPWKGAEAAANLSPTWQEDYNKHATVNAAYVASDNTTTNISAAVAATWRYSTEVLPDNSCTHTCYRSLPGYTPLTPCLATYMTSLNSSSATWSSHSSHHSGWL